MLFNTFEFIGFFILILSLIYILNQHSTVTIRNVVLLLVSYAFYAHLHIWYPLLLLWVTGINYIGGKYVATCRNARFRQVLISITIVLSLLPLGLLKYLPAYVPSLWLPVGLSFFTFQALTYSIDIYRGKIQPASLQETALFIAFFPTLLSGPIERARNLMPQLRNKLPLNWNNLLIGTQFFIWGLFKKVVIADRLSEYIDTIYAAPDVHSGSTLALAAILYSFQIYCDFSGYAMMALGVGRMLGIELTNNFAYPYFATTIKDFWRRWHISLTSWFTEYVYISMGGNRVSARRWIINISAVFLLSGIWHGATLAFVIWGGIHALLYLLEHRLHITKGGILYAPLVFIGVTLAWVFFRMPTFSEACTVLSRIFSPSWGMPALGSSAFSMAITLSYLLLMIGIEWIFYRKWAFPSFIRGLGAIFIILSIGLFAISKSQFVYFQF